MRKSSKLTLRCVLLCALLGAPSVANADCVVVNSDIREAFRESDVVFSGIVTDVDVDGKLRFQVDRVWKGPIARTVWIHQLDQPVIESYVFRPRPDVKYIIFGRELSAEDRKFRVEDGEARAFGIHGSCGTGPRFTREHARELDSITRAKKPRG